MACLDDVKADCAASVAESELIRDARTVRQTIGSIWDDVAQKVDLVVDLSVKHGNLATLLGQLPESHQLHIQTTLATLARVYPEFTDAPFPELPTGEPE